MIRATYGNLLPELSRVAGTTGMSLTDERMLIRVNLAVQELMNEGAWPGVVDRWHIRAVDGKIVLPAELDMLLEFTVDGVPQTIMSPWAEFVNYGPGMQEDILPRHSNLRTWWGCYHGNVYDRGELPVYTQIPVSDGSCDCTDIPVGPWFIRQYATRSETADIYSTVQGTKDGMIVRTEVPTSDGSGTEWINGERIPISDGSGYFQSTETFDTVTAYTKPETNGYIRITAWNGTDEIELSNYAPWETTPSYHHYWSPRLQSLSLNSANECLRVVLARCRRRFVPVEENTDVMIISNVLALKEMMIAQWKREADNLESYAAHKQTAIDIMKKESIAYTGKVRMPALTMSRGAGLGTMPAIR